MQKTKPSPYYASYGKLRSCNPPEAEDMDYVNLLKGGVNTEQAVIKLRLSKPPRTGIETYQYLQQKRKQKQMSFFTDFLRWYQKIDVMPSLEAMQKRIAFHHNNDIYMLKLSGTLPNLANICLHKSTVAKFYPFREGDKLLEKIGEEAFGGPSIIFTRKALVDETFIRNSANICKSFVGIEVDQLYPYSKCHSMPTGLYSRWDLDSETSNFTSRRNKTRGFENTVMSFFQRTRPEWEIESFFRTGRQKKSDCVSVDGFCSHCNTVFETMGCFDHFCPCQKLRGSLTEEDIQRGSSTREVDALRRHYIQEKGYNLIEMWECGWWRLCRTTITVKQDIREHFPYRCLLAIAQFSEEINEGKLFGQVQCYNEVPEGSRANFANFTPSIKNTLVSKSDIGDFIKNYAEEKDYCLDLGNCWFPAPHYIKESFLLL